MKLITLREFLSSDRYAKKLLGGPSWAGWRALLLATMGEVLTEADLADFIELTLRTEAPSEACREAYFVIGRRGGTAERVVERAPRGMKRPWPWS